MNIDFHAQPRKAASGCPIVHSFGESASLESDTLLHLLLENACQGVVVVDRTGTILVANDVATRMFNYDARELIGSRIETLMTESLRVEHARHRVVFMNDGYSRSMAHEKELNGVRSDGTSFPCEIGLSCLRGNVRGNLAVAFITDITSRKRTEEQLAAQMRELEKFANILVHDLKTPLRSSLLANELMEQALKDGSLSELEDLCAMTSKAMAGMHKTIEALHEYTKPNPKVSFAPVSMNEVIEQTITHLSYVLTQSAVKLTQDPLPTVYGHAPQLVQLMQNLIGNAIKYSDTNATIHVSASATENGHMWRFSVTDTGIGIPEAMQERIFEPFKRACDSSKYEGSGLGLSTCRSIIKRHHGHIWCKSSEGVGTTFFFTLSTDCSSQTDKSFLQAPEHSFQACSA